MIHDVDETLRALVRRDVTDRGGIDVSFDAPTRDWAARRQGPTIDLYLYDVREDLDRRVHGVTDVRDDRGVVVERRRPPRRFNLSYLVTAWTQRAEDEHRLLSALLRTLIGMESLPAELLQGELVTVAEPIGVTVGLPPGQDRSLSDVWSALGGELKPSLDVVVSAPFGLPADQAVGPPVLEGPVVTLFGPDGQLLQRRATTTTDGSAEKQPLAGMVAPAVEVVDGGRSGTRAPGGEQGGAPAAAARRARLREAVTEQDGTLPGRRITMRQRPRQP